jgi:signal transduction protein with GAF and PtsI domain
VTDRLGPEAVELLRAIGMRAETARRLRMGSAEAVLRSIVEATVALFGAEAASIALYDPPSDQLVFRVAAGVQGQGVVGLSVPTSQGLVGYVYTTGQALALADVRKDARFGRQFAEQTQYVPRSIVAVPLADDHGTRGVLEVLDKRDEASFSLRDIELASVFARQAAVAISASRVERDIGELLRSVLTSLAEDDAPTAPIDEIVGAATTALATSDESHLWLLVDRVARIGRADPAQLALVADLLGVVAEHAERSVRPRRSTRMRTRPGT